MQKPTILIVDDEPQILLVLRDRLRMHGYHTLEAANGIEALHQIEANIVDLMLLDLKMPELDGIGVLKRLKDMKCDLPVIILTAHGSIDQAVDAMKLGAIDFLSKPCNPDHILIVLNKVLRNRQVRDENLYLRNTLNEQHRMIVGRSERMQHIMRMVEKVSQQNSTVLINGESGTGKQLLARAIHQQSRRSHRPFVQVTSTTIHENLTESDLFGHEKGAFTGAVSLKKGRFEIANQGTLFLDEIGDLSPSVQAKLLRVLEYGEYQRVGGVHTLKCDVRIIAATNKRLEEEIRQVRFREDLFFRIHVFHITLPPLRERMEDLPVFAEHFLKKHGKRMQKQMHRIDKNAMRILTEYHWPGNIRELENVIERAVVLANNDCLTPDLLPLLDHSEKQTDGITDPSLEEAVHRFKRNHIISILKQNHYNQTQTAKILNIQRTYLNRLMKQLDIQPE